MKTVTLFAGGLLLSASAAAQGLADGVAVDMFPTGYSQYAKDLKVGADGTIWAVVEHPNLQEAKDEYDTEHVAYEWRAQCYGRDGVAKFGNEGILVSNYNNISYSTVNDYLFVDRDGNAIVMVNDCRNSASTGRSYTIYKLSPEGKHLWDSEGVNLEGATTYDVVSHMNCLQLEDGSYVLAWTGISERDETLTISRMARIKADGTKAWVKDLCTAEKPATNPILTNAGSNEYIVTYIQSTVVYSAKYDFDGEAVWKSPTRVYRGGLSTTTPAYTILSASATPDGGVLVAWYDDRNTSGYESAYVSYITNSGKLGFAGASDEGDVKVAYINDLRNISIKATATADGSGFVAIWRVVSANNWVGVHAQRISLSGELLWGDEGYEVEPLRTAELSYFYVSVRPATGGDVGLFYTSYNANYDQQCYCRLLNASGKPAWADPTWQFTPNNVASADLRTIRVSGDDPYWLAWWHETTPETGNFNGTLKMMRIPFARPTGGIGQVADDNAGPADGNVYDLTGRMVANPTAHGVYIRNGRKIML